MPRVNPEIMVWAREAAGLNQEGAARKLGFQDSRVSSAAYKLAALENGDREPSRTQLVKMAAQYHRPLLTFYLSSPPRQGDLGTDFRTLRGDSLASDSALLNALVRDIRARQSMVRAVLEDDDEAEPLPFVGSHRLEDGRTAVLRTLQVLISVDYAAYRKQPNPSAAFNLLRRRLERRGVFVVLKGDIGNYQSALDTTAFRGFSIADDVAPFIVINEYDARSAWSFTLLHETVHLLLGQTGVSGEYSGNEVEQFCDDIAGDFLLPPDALERLDIGDVSNFEDVSDRISAFAKESRVSRTMVAYKAYRASKIGYDLFNRLSSGYRREWRARKQRGRTNAPDQNGGPSYYVLRRHRLGNKLVSFVKDMMAADSLSTSKASRILGVKPRQVLPLTVTGR